MSPLAPDTLAAAPSARRSRLYALLATAFGYPSAELGPSLAGGQLPRQLRSAADDLPYPLSSARALAAPPGLAPAELEQAYLGLFEVGSAAGAPCSLYEGEYGGGRMGVLEDVLRFYRFFGLRLSEDPRDRPDHLATELEFLHWLAFHESQALAGGRVEAARGYAGAARDFLAEHAVYLAERVAAHASARQTPLYPALAALVAEFCAADLAWLQTGGRAAAVTQGERQAAIRLDLRRLREADVEPQRPYSLRAVRSMPLRWDSVVKSSHLGNCHYQRSCNFNLYVLDGVVLREEQVGSYPGRNDPAIPDPNPRGCQKGVCYARHAYDPVRLKYPLKRVGARGEGRWQRLSWDQALTEIADKLLDVLITDGPHAIIQAGGTMASASDSLAYLSFFEALGCSVHTQNVELGDDHQGAAVTAGKIVFGDSTDNWFYADLLLVWGGNPAYTNIPNFHYLTEARYRGVRIVTITPDYSASAIHADLWVPVNIGADAALALGMCQVILAEGLYRADFVREQTDLPLLVRADTGRFLREKDLKRGGREDAFYLWDAATGRLAEAPRKSLALGELVPALEGEYQVQTLQGPVRVRPVFQVLRELLDARYTPDQAARVAGTPAALIQQLAREVAVARGVCNVTTYNWGKLYHGDLIERAIMLLFALCGHMGRRGATYSAMPWMACDTTVGSSEIRGSQKLLAAMGADPRYAAWKEDGYTDEMVMYEYAKQSVASGGTALTSLVHYLHGGLLELSDQHRSWDPALKRRPREYMQEALDRGWQIAMPPVEVRPRIMFQVGGNVFRRGRATNQLLSVLLPKLEMLVTVDWRMTATALYSDYVLPACGWYERNATTTVMTTQTPYIQVNNRAIAPLYESLGDWAIFVRLARKLDERAKARGISTIRDRDGNERRLGRVEDAVTAGGLYAEDDDEGVARDAFVNASNVEPMSWEDFKERGFAHYTALGKSIRAMGNACDVQLGEPIVPLTWHTEKKQPYPTLTRRLQFYIDHELYLELGEALPVHKDCPKAGGDYPLQVTGGHARWSVQSNWTDDALLLALQRGEPGMFMAAEDAAARGVADGDKVEVFNDVGSFRVQAIVSPAVRPGQVILYHAWENHQFQGWRHYKSVMASPLNPVELAGGYGHIRPDPIAFAPGASDRDTRVEVRKVG